MEGVEVGENGERLEEPGPVERSAEAASKLGLEAESGAGGQTRLGGPLQCRGDRNKKTRGRVEARGTEEGVEAARRLGQGAGHAPGWQVRTGPVDKLPEDMEKGVLGGGMYTGTGADVEEVAEWLGAVMPG
jgi:hypothetical protein